MQIPFEKVEKAVGAMRLLKHKRTPGKKTSLNELLEYFGFGLLVVYGVLFLGAMAYSWWCRDYLKSYECEDAMLSPEQAHAIVSDHWGELRFAKLVNLTADAAECLALSRGGNMTFSCLSVLSSDAEVALAGYSGQLVFPSLTELKTDSLAHKLAASGYELSLSSLKSITVEAAQVLGDHEGELNLDGLEDLSPHVAWGLSKHRGPISLNGVKTMSPETALALATIPRHLERMHTTRVNGIPAQKTQRVLSVRSLLGLVEVEPETLGILREQSLITLPDALRQ